ncbi:hypothetical protein LEP1GSC036_4544 [Leptospira weilii str. 2006001853]|uniref:Uncharacterized protein n=4 Tax=Leptospira weilii TaxID=28184 RepID=A0A828Z3F7_9LEPT|nr:hypothetical protein [Leptospira weilii]EKR64827.1 hypothetical protein LEP1GSC036_4544 [Leptospira weilii str. 2006001853]EMJ60037.1 hypothetical protein LEP1GSC051_0500 [Leptospira sp. P2653]EMM71785.1 hypothetical protein LEP1GSC038_4089 [Leptospira weilii str. 2006001855]EMY15705.1 hypothetical protein LEP1GSC043_0701 [Leptospira weilii str. Ecochallenge]MCL8268061.1 hypothetical protein [Leptospira weilii]
MGETSTDKNGKFIFSGIRYNQFLLTEIFQMGRRIYMYQKKLKKGFYKKEIIVLIFLGEAEEKFLNGIYRYTYL